MCDEAFAADWLDNVYEEEYRALLEEYVQVYVPYYSRDGPDSGSVTRRFERNRARF